MNKESRKSAPNTCGAGKRREFTDEETNKVSGGALKSFSVNWTCPGCGASNESTDSKCKDCGMERYANIHAR